MFNLTTREGIVCQATQTTTTTTHEPELWPYRKDLLISTAPLDDLIGGVLDDRIVEIGSRGDLGDRVDTDFTEEDFDVFTGRDTGERTRWLYDIGDPARDPIDDAVIANDNSVETSPILAITLSGHYNVMPGTKPIDSTKTISLDESIDGGHRREHRRGRQWLHRVRRDP